MGIDKQNSKGGNYVGGFLQMFDWNSKSRKKLFSSKSDLPEQSKQKKTRDGNFPKTRLHMLDADESGSSVKGSSDHSCCSSVIDEDFCGSTKAPGVVARLMGLDSLPKSSLSESYSGPLYGSQDSYYQAKRLDFYQDQTKYQKVIHRPIEKFQTEILPPKSAKSIPITHHKLLSPIKSGGLIASKDAAQIMEAAARIIDPGQQERRKITKQPSVGSSSAPLRVRDLKQKAEKPSKILEGSRRKGESSGVKNVKEQSMNKSWNGSEESLVDSKNKSSKSISLALQAKANVQKREALNVKKEQSELSPKTGLVKKPSLQNGSGVLRQNNQKQNCIVDKGKSPSISNSKGGKTFNKESSSTRQRTLNKVNSRNDKREVASSSTERITSKKRSADGNYHSVKNQGKSGKAIQSRDITDRQSSSCSQESGATTGNDVVSFTFTSPMARSEGSGRPTEGTSPSRFSRLGHNVKGGDALNILLEQKLKELARKVEFSKEKSGEDLSEGSKVRDGMHSDYQSQKLMECHNPSPVSVLENSPFAESCNSSDTAETNSSTGSKQFVDLSDSASSNSPKKEAEYVKEMLHNVDLMFKDYTLGISHEIIKPPRLYNQDQRHMFDCVGEVLDLRFRQYVGGGFRLWAKGVSVIRRKDRLAEEVYKEISGWSSNIEESMIDELVDKDMSNQYGKWLDFDNEAFEVGVQIESIILNSLIDEVVADML